jgi:hypothetical protein
MSTSFTRYQIRFTLILLLCCSLVLGACDSLAGSGQYSSQEQALESGEEGAFDEIDLSGASEDADGDSEGEESSGEPVDDPLWLFVCPESPTPVEISSNYDIKFKTPQYGTWDITGQGTQVITIAEGVTDQAVAEVNRASRNYGTVIANFSRDDQKCSFKDEIEIVSHVDGSCQDSVLSLNITTNFGEADTTITCCSNGDCDSSRFKWLLPVVQFGDIQFTEDTGFYAEKEFTGGEGIMTWQITVAMPPVPID